MGDTEREEEMILVIGCGFVGETVAKSLEAEGHTVTRIDPKYNDNKIMYISFHLLALHF